MRLLDVRVMHGANYFSGGPVLIFRVDLGEYDEVFSNDIDGFAAALERTLPSLVEHQCSEGVRGGFLERVREGTLLGHITVNESYLFRGAQQFSALAEHVLATIETSNRSRPLSLWSAGCARGEEAATLLVLQDLTEA